MNATLKAYLECALWSSTGDDEQPLDGAYRVGDFAPEAVEAAARDIAMFLADPKVAAILEHPDFPEDFGPVRIGYNLWLTRNGHGAGFWDRNELEPNGWGNTLSEVARAMGEKYPYVGDDGRVHIQ